MAEGAVNKFYESDEINITPPDKGGATAKFELFVKGPDDYVPVIGEIDLNIQGYELTNAQGVIMERYITKVNL